MNLKKFSLKKYNFFDYYNVKLNNYHDDLFRKECVWVFIFESAISITNINQLRFEEEIIFFHDDTVKLSNYQYDIFRKECVVLS